MKKQTSVAFIILNWKGWRHTIAFLESLYQSTYANFTVLVIDNGSTDNSIENINAWAASDLIVDAKLFKYTAANKPISILQYHVEESPIASTEHILTERTIKQNKIRICRRE